MHTRSKVLLTIIAACITGAVFPAFVGTQEHTLQGVEYAAMSPPANGVDPMVAAAMSSPGSMPTASASFADIMRYARP